MNKKIPTNYRLTQPVKDDFKKFGKGNETCGVEFARDVVKKLGLKKARKLLEEG